LSFYFSLIDLGECSRTDFDRLQQMEQVVAVVAVVVVVVVFSAVGHNFDRIETMERKLCVGGGIKSEQLLPDSSKTLYKIYVSDIY
jgi:hypothetical protein